MVLKEASLEKKMWCGNTSRTLNFHYISLMWGKRIKRNHVISITYPIPYHFFVREYVLKACFGHWINSQAASCASMAVCLNSRVSLTLIHDVGLPAIDLVQHVISFGMSTAVVLQFSICAVWCLQSRPVLRCLFSLYSWLWRPMVLCWE